MSCLNFYVLLIYITPADVDVTIQNNTALDLQCVTQGLQSGSWQQSFPQTINAHTTAQAKVYKIMLIRCNFACTVMQLILYCEKSCLCMHIVHFVAGSRFYG